ncbi:MAG TPA: helix-turn-helix domain-containing protein [Longimicrobium sp.]|nr:helix-turn-helix domain-containing protein [Longimicrobium sp.]
MKDELFQELLESVRQGGAILRGEAEASRAFEFPEKDGAPDVAKIRERFGVSQPRFAEMLGISVGTLRNWEQGRRTPDGPATVLLEVAYRYPGAVWGVVRERRARYGEPDPPRTPAPGEGGDGGES